MLFFVDFRKRVDVDVAVSTLESVDVVEIGVKRVDGQEGKFPDVPPSLLISQVLCLMEFYGDGILDEYDDMEAGGLYWKYLEEQRYKDEKDVNVLVEAFVYSMIFCGGMFGFVADFRVVFNW